VRTALDVPGSRWSTSVRMPMTGPVCGLKRAFRRLARRLSVPNGREMAMARRPLSLPPSTYNGLGGLWKGPGRAAEFVGRKPVPAKMESRSACVVDDVGIARGCRTTGGACGGSARTCGCARRRMRISRRCWSASVCAGAAGPVGALGGDQRAAGCVPARGRAGRRAVRHAHRGGRGVTRCWRPA
jgi:hypothetical protein